MKESQSNSGYRIERLWIELSSYSMDDGTNHFLQLTRAIKSMLIWSLSLLILWIWTGGEQWNNETCNKIENPGDFQFSRLINMPANCDEVRPWFLSEWADLFLHFWLSFIVALRIFKNCITQGLSEFYKSHPSLEYLIVQLSRPRVWNWRWHFGHFPSWWFLYTVFFFTRSITRSRNKIIL